MKLNLFLILIASLLTGACLNNPQNQTSNAPTNAAPRTKDPDKKLNVGISLATVKEERWQRDFAAFNKRCGELQINCIIKVANNDSSRQTSDVENLLTQKIDVLLIAPQDATQAAALVEKAKAQNIPVISYDRLINSDKIDVYISHQVPVIGRKIAEYALEKVPEGNYVMVYGASTDNNAVIMKKEQLDVLKPALDAKKIKIVADNFITDWKPEEALKMAENALTKNNDNIQAFVVSNDGMAGGVISALEKRGLAGKILVTGQDAQLDALQRIAEGRQTMTIYKPIIPLANAALDAAVKLTNGEPLADAKPFRNDNLGNDVPAILLEIQVVDKNNLLTTVIKDGYAKFDDVYKNVPADQRPKQ